MECIDIADDCRACQTKIQEESQKVFIFNTVKLPDIFKETTSLYIHENDGLPKVLCSSCYDRLLEAFNFKKMCSAAVLHFQSMLSMDDYSEEKYILPENLTICGIANETRHELKSHTKTHKKDDNWFCVFCSYKSTRFLYLKHHIKVLHRGIKDYHCSQCAKSFTTAPSLRDHMLRHADIKNHVCTVCGVKKVTRTELRKHMIIHSEKMLSCEFCPLKFLRGDSLKQHIRIVHQEIKEHYCTICNKTFAISRTLKNHLMIHTGEKPHACTKCPKKYIRSDQLKLHMKLHTGKDTFSCESCSFKTNYLHDLKNHVNVVHEGVKDNYCDSYQYSS
uniref:Uncharacterized protein n=1 Tax=Phlebotomus papatasi TaxID=29031 RepID=A0A1B0DQE0_PHLPP